MDNIKYIKELESLHEIEGLEKLLGNINIYHPIQRSGKKYYYNLTLFEEFAGVKHTKKFNYTKLKVVCEKKIQETLNTFLYLQEKLLSDHIISEAILENIIQLKLIKNGLDFELLKAGAKIPLNSIEYNNRLKLQEIYETDLYGGPIYNNSYETKICLTELVESYKKNKSRLNPNEQKQYKKYIKQINHFLEQKGKSSKIFKNKSQSFHWQTKIFFKRYGKLPISRELYTKIFRYSLDILELKDIKIVTTKASGFSVGKDEFRIPEGSDFDIISIGKMFRLIYHEIVGHLLNWKNHGNCFHEIRGKKSVMKEEGVSMLLESLMMGERFDSINLKPSTFARILAGEILEGGDFRTFIRLRKKLAKGKISTTTGSFLRHKINYPRYEIGVQHKDVSYVRGLIETIEFIKRGGNPQALFSGKFSLEDIESGRCDFTDASEFQPPFPIVDIIIHAIMTGNDAPKDKKVKLKEDFRFFLLNKYGPCFRMFHDTLELSKEQNEKLLFMIQTVKARKLFGKHKVVYQPIENMMIEHNRDIRNIIK